ncbi:hypothetical protein BJY04DRAFT_207849 [Aspergillus karnatakaensis]|uniref:uncharacterized protein n=1 Tax=Aspergillus karnatakaensis TaxID=1810916 RepID=UPI003CCD4032
MATLAEHPVVAQTPYDQDIDTFLNLDQLSYTPSEPARSKIGLATQPSLPNTDFVPSDPRGSSFASSSQSPVAFPAPSHQYDEHKQQTGLPPGALAQAIPFSQMTPMGYGATSPGFAVSNDMFQPQMKRDEASLDFTATPTRNISDMDLESDSSMATVGGFYYPPNSDKTQYVDPNALGGQEMVPMGSSTQVGRMYPGMHQQAAMAKAAQQQRQHDQLRQQHQQLQQQRMVATPQAQQPHAANPMVEERITRLLQQMKSASGSSSDSSPSPSAAPQLAKSKKDEQDMDEDERLLASEEGKKLSSKERRQLRNKVSARAFRSRRKEYIVQLESEVTQRSNEAQELRLQNRALFEENARLTDLARQLLSSAPFAQYLDEMNVNNLPSAPTPMPHQSQPQPQPPTISQPVMQQANLHKEAIPNHGQPDFSMPQQMTQTSQVGMMMVPSQGMDVSTINMSNGGWNSGIDVNFGNAPVFAVLEVPEPVGIDIEALSSKSSGYAGSGFGEASRSKDPLNLERPPHIEPSQHQVVADAGELNVEVDESDPVLALFADQPRKSTSESHELSFAGIEPCKPSTFELVVETGSEAAADRLAYLCQTMEDTFQRYHFEILTTPTADTRGTAIALHYPDKSYVFGQISEGTQRACTENGTKLTHISNIFLTGRTGWDNTGGLLGLVLTQADGVVSSAAAHKESIREKEAKRRERSNGKDQAAKQGDDPSNDTQNEKDTQKFSLTIHGAKNLAHTMATARRFIFRQGMPVRLEEYTAENTSRNPSNNPNDPCEQPTWTDSNIKVWAMPISPFSTSPRPQSPRKRSLDEFRGHTKSLNSSTESDQLGKEEELRRSVVNSMFNSSDWKYDSLVEIRLVEADQFSPMYIRDPTTKDLIPYTGPRIGQKEVDPDKKVLIRLPWPGASLDRIPTAKQCDEALCYIIKAHDTRGKFSVNKAREHGVKAGRDYGILANGHSVTTQSGQLVTPEMVLEAPRPGNALAIIDLPTADYIESLLRRPEFRSPTILQNLKAFVWILGPGVGDHPLLRAFIGEFNAAMPHVEHVVSSPDYCANYLTMQSAASSTIRMARLTPKNYGIPVHNNTVSTPPMSAELPFEQAEPGLVINMAPEFKVNQEDVVPRLNTASVLREMPTAPSIRVSEISRQLQKSESQERLKQYLKDLPGADAEIITLGTGSSVPSKYRNVSSTLLHVPGTGYYLLDCGEGTLGQLQRIFTKEQLREVLQNLRMIWVSHLHADHHLGTVSVIKAWYQENYPGGVLKEKRLFVEYAGVEDFGFAKLTPLTAIPFSNDPTEPRTTFLYRHCHADGSFSGREVKGAQPSLTELSFNNHRSGLTPLLKQATGLADLNTVYVHHCRDAMAVSLTFPDGFKVSFSGDCRPSEKFAVIGRNSTVLIHEATFQDEMAGSAMAKRHSTVSEAIGVGRQRYQKVASLDQPGANDPVDAQLQDSGFQLSAPDISFDNDADEESATRDAMANLSKSGSPQPPVVPIVTAFDYMRVRVRDMLELEAYTPAVQELYDILERNTLNESKKRKAEHAAEQAKRMDERLAIKKARELKMAAASKAARAERAAEKRRRQELLDEIQSEKESSSAQEGAQTGTTTPGEEPQQPKSANSAGA